jgi:hypothetical protein
MKEYAELSQLKKGEMSQNDPSKIEVGKFAIKKWCRDKKAEMITRRDMARWRMEILFTLRKVNDFSSIEFSLLFESKTLRIETSKGCL